MARKTIYDIAKKANVSIATVSRVINNSSEISEDTRHKVLEIADEMGYYPQAYAQGLARKEKNRIMILVPVISNYFFMEVLAGIQDEISNNRNDYELNIFNINGSGDRIYRQVETVIKKHSADGYILISTHLDDRQLQNLLKYQSPISLVDEMHPDIDSVAVDDEEGTDKAMAYFLEQGYERIAFISASQTSKPSKKRIQGYRDALEKAGLPADPSLIVTGDSMYRDGFSENNGYEAMLKLLSLPEPPDACFCASDIQAIGAIKALREKDMNIPIIGYDDITISDYIGLSTVQQPMYEMGAHATKMLLRRMDDEERSATQTTFSPKLMLRATTENHSLPGNG